MSGEVWCPESGKRCCRPLECVQRGCCTNGRPFGSPPGELALPAMPGTLPLSEQLREVRREIALRQRVYPRWIESGKGTKARAEVALAAMEAVAETLAGLIREQEAKRPH